MIKLYYHNGSSNHGCEAIVRSTCKILDCPIQLYSFNSDEDKKYKLDDVCEIKDDVSISINNRLSYYFAAAYKKIFRSDYLFIKKFHAPFFRKIKKGDICMSIGGDNYCYNGIEILAAYNKEIKRRGAKTVLWGCSVEPYLLTKKEVVKDLKRYDLIIARESISYAALYNVNKNTFLFPDPAFQLDYNEYGLDAMVLNNAVGINVSPLISDYETKEGITHRSYEKLVEYIIENTDMQIVLIPHVVSDLDVLKKLYDRYKTSNRVLLVEDLDCMKVKGIIKNCRFLITARTHASIAAYSTCIPTIVVGYSVKAVGIAKDIFGTSDNYVLSVESIRDDMELIYSFQWLVKNESKIINHLKHFMPSYKERALQAKSKVFDIL